MRLPTSIRCMLCALAAVTGGTLSLAIGELHGLAEFTGWAVGLVALVAAIGAVVKRAYRAGYKRAISDDTFRPGSN